MTVTQLYTNCNCLVCAYILTLIDYCNALFAGLPDSTIAPLQRVLHAAARFVGAFNHETM